MRPYPDLSVNDMPQRPTGRLASITTRSAQRGPTDGKPARRGRGIRLAGPARVRVRPGGGLPWGDLANAERRRRLSGGRVAVDGRSCRRLPPDLGPSGSE
ncbi:hypothetical protein Arub01_08340 [Actinomadura rubrobrunea]|uniref:Uncharacterized protein n=1 Tax=Actinomadura rubrobrunea TaxID=115335 RepID=A0A9W6PQE0_9ACTN|nr:hypothetical protein Arub01_08340 [Actinomadura rubrobrunea]